MFAMSGHAKKLSDLGIVIPNKLEIKKENQVLMVNKTTSFKKQGKPNKGNFKKGGKKVAAPPEKPKAGPKPETVCYYCQGKGHWKRNCTKYLADLKSGHAKERSEGKIFVAKNGSFLEKEFLTKEVTGRKVELGEVDEPSLIDQSSAVPEEVPVQPAPIGEEANDDDHETSTRKLLNLSDRRGNVPLLIGKVLSKTQGPATADERERMSKIPYASAVGSIMYAMLCTRPDIAHVVSLTSRYQSDPGMEHWTAVKNILKYLKRTKDMFLCYGGDQELVCYTDASWNTDPDDSKSQSGYVFILNGAAVSWSSSKQCTVAKSSTESEYIAASEASCEAVWMKRFIVELGVVPSALDPLVIYCDNTGAIANAKEPRSHKKLKHIKLRFHSIREYIEDGEVEICKVHTDLNVADPLTKALPRAKHDQHQNAMGVSYLTM
ncbi:hypothetical protein QYE76_035179 [Lolium multiflorum]|uniref:CCHC-type domain-containing protein n=1 Tax=Lolium multiflorum TaxID=4521 RepID=A0AAD8QZ77_LOLMU|nr:hypothetical protein QYE76_035179 [Lolium multiflorum]